MAAGAAGGAPDRDLALAQVLGSTGCEDPAEALQALEAAGWDVDAAIAALLNSLHGAAPPHAAAGPPDAGAAAGREEGGAGHGEGARGHAAGAAGAPWYLRAPLALTLSVFRLAWAVVGAGVSLAGAVVWPLLGAAGLTEYVDPAAAAAEAAPAFIADYEASYEDVARPEWLSMTFERATAHAARELKFLVAYLHAPAHGDTDAFCREALSDGEVLAQLAGGDFVAWGADVSSPDGARLARALRVGRRPVVAIMLTLDSRATLVGMADAQGGAQGLRAALVAAVEEYSAELVVARADAAEMQVSRRLREEQDEALAASLRADQEREAQEAARLAEEAEARHAAEEEEAAAAAAEVAEAAREAEREATITSRNERARASLGEEPAAGTPGTAMVAVRWPDGGRRQRRFLAKEPVQRVYDWAAAEGMPFDRFTLMSSFPKKELGEDALSATLEETGLAPQAMLMVRQEDE